ncbi:MAG TPA: hypothetical protein PLK34_00390 [Candidatus Pacearchaeota archaeon]|nr:hypothetical protein [Candidatus Pacearchaeota archaeon]
MNKQTEFPDVQEIRVGLADLEEKQRALKNQLILVGKNLIESREKTKQDILSLKRDMEIVKQEINRMVSFLETLSGEISRFARKEDLEILIKQARMFQPLERRGVN